MIIDLLEKFGQGGNCEHDGELYYHNSFIMANADDAWVLETVDKQWAAKQIKDVYSISNCLTIKDQWDIASPDLVDLAVQKGFAKSSAKFRLRTRLFRFHLSQISARDAIAAQPLSIYSVQQRGKVSVESMMGTLRHHNDEHFDPQDEHHRSGCVHARGLRSHSREPEHRLPGGLFG